MPKGIAQPSPNSNPAPRANDSFEKLIQKVPSNMSASAVNKYSTCLLVCGSPSITDVEEQCDLPIRLH
jgi:hypothetical protein